MRSYQVLILLVLSFSIATQSVAQGDPKSFARSHANEGVRLYTAGDYKAAIEQFARAEALVPSAGNDLNRALCYDKLGDIDNSLSMYQSYLARSPSAANKIQIEANIARLQNAKFTADAKKEADRRAKEKLDAEQKRIEAEKKLAADKAAAAKAAAEKAEADRRAGIISPMAADETYGDLAAVEPAPVEAPGATPPLSGGPSLTTTTPPAAETPATASLAPSLTNPSAPNEAGIDGGPSARLPLAGPIEGNPIAPTNPEPKPKKSMWKKPTTWIAVSAFAIVAIYVMNSSDSSSGQTRVPQNAALLRW